MAADSTMGETPRWSSGALVVGGISATFAVFAADRTTIVGPYLAMAGLLVAALGILDLLGAFEADPDDVARAIPIASLRAPLLVVAGAFVLTVLALRAATAGLLGVAPAAVVVPLVFIGLLVSVRALATRLGAAPLTRERPRLWIVLGAVLLYLPLLGGTALIDPWETHYGEVAREMIARGDWLSTWWAQDRWFWTKPVLDLWLEATSMRALGVHAHAGEMLAPVLGFTPRPEWALRLPSFLFAISGLYLMSRGVARSLGERAGALAAVALATMPQFFLMARQATTDMPLVGSLTAALGLVLVANAAEARERAPSCAVKVGPRVLHLSLAHLVLVAASLLVLSQALYLASRNVTLHVGAAPSFDVHADTFNAGSPGNCDLPGNAPCTIQAPITRLFPPALQALVWLGALAVVLVNHRRERRLRRVAYLGAFLFGALATMAKGPLGVVLPGCAFLAALAVTGRWKRLAATPIATGTLLVLAATLPWYIALLTRHGTAFTDELVMKHMIGRATSHLHDTNQGDDVSFRYYVWQGGYALFGWAGLAPLALAWWPRDDGPSGARHRFARAFALLWVVLAFALFTVMPTKFHHYIFPALPGVAVLLGSLLDDLLDREAVPLSSSLRVALVGGAVLVLLCARDLATPGLPGEGRLLNLVTYNYQRPWPDTVVVRPILAAAGVAFAVLLVAASAPRLRRWALLGFLAASTAFAVWGLDGYFVKVSPHWAQHELVETYMRERTSAADPLAAYNMNWKGENFYTGNHVAVFPAGGKIRPWIEARRTAGAEAFFFLIEHGRINALKGELGAGVSTTLLTTPAQQNKFVLVRASFDQR